MSNCILIPLLSAFKAILVESLPTPHSSTTLPTKEFDAIFLAHTCQSKTRMVERKHDHISIVGQCFLHQASMPLVFWIDAYNSATFVINLMSSINTSNMSPYELLFRQCLIISFYEPLAHSAFQSWQEYSATNCIAQLTKAASSTTPPFIRVIFAMN